ncbi:hypothetical protein [uncultured Tateyamaria sp.]|uniref:hypothetical protein n=1 Tax=uncultured Tateyamaria sp. TaxID=455651 RepID=UPI0026181D44|nr:hypothetical protein [uncultured Tateyamaria sp.]
MKRVITRPNTCNGQTVSQTVEKRIVLTEIESIEVKNFRAPAPFMATFEVAIERPTTFSLLRDRITLGEEEALRRYMQRLQLFEDESDHMTGTYFSLCDGSESQSQSVSETLFLIDRPIEWDSFVALAESCGVQKIDDNYMAP